MGLLPSLLALALAVGGISDAHDYGPIPMANHHPLYIGTLYPVAEVAQIAPAPSMCASVNHTNIFLFNKGQEWHTAVDKEITQLDLSFTYPLSEWNMHVSMDASGYYSSGGFLDGIVRWWHGRLGVKGYYGQADSPDYRFMDTVGKNGRAINNGDMGAKTGDVNLSLKKLLYREENLAVSGQAILQAPTGDADAGYGAGVWEFAGRILAEMRSAPLTIHAGVGAVAPAQMKRMGQTIDFDTMWMGFASAEIPVWERLNLVVQSMYNTSPLRSADIYQYSREFVEVTFGLNYKTVGGKVFTFGFSENLNQTAPDFTIHMSVKGGI